MKLFLLLTFFLGVAMILANELVKTPPVRVQYRYIPRDLDTFYRTIPALSETHGAMFLNKNIDTA
jgi:hypothetical protein